MKSTYQFIIDANLEQTKSTLRSAEYDKSNIDKLYCDLFNNCNCKTDSRKYRIYIPFTFNTNLDNIITYESSAFKEVKKFWGLYDYLKPEKYKNMRLDYYKGYFYNSKNQPIKVVKAFQDLIVIAKEINEEYSLAAIEDLELAIKLFINDPLRTSDFKQTVDYEKLMIVISKHPLDILNQSTDRKWCSCMNLDGCDKSAYVASDIKYGTLVAYLVYTDDINIKNPIARISIKPLLNIDSNQDKCLFVSNKIYSGLSSRPDMVILKFFKKDVEDFIENNFNKQVKSGKYKLHDKLYNDDKLAIIYK